MRCFVYNPSLCIGCRSCETACRNENGVISGKSWRQVKEVKDDSSESTYYLSVSCNHCENPECLRVCSERTYRKRQDGIVLHDSRRCIGCSNCINSCPFQAPKFVKSTGKVDKCNMCVQRIDQGLECSCVVACPTGAIRMDILPKVQTNEYVKSIPGFGKTLFTKPTTRFINSMYEHSDARRNCDE